MYVDRGLVILCLIIIAILMYLLSKCQNNHKCHRKYICDINGHKIVVFQCKDADWPNFKSKTWFEIYIPRNLVSVYEKIKDEVVSYSQYGGSAIKRRKQLYIGGRLAFDTWDGTEIINEGEAHYEPDYNLYDAVSKDYYVIVTYNWRSVEHLLSLIKDQFGAS